MCTPAADIPFTVGVLAVVGAIIRAKVSNPARILRWLVPTVFVLLLNPDVDILISDSQPVQQPRRRRRADATHVVVVAVFAVTALTRALPVLDRRSRMEQPGPSNRAP